ncbi:hypothetical protein MK489_21875 [Myxococcota bacterium]|nr:hypothetical protein [Myxococcota bacterium]
MSLGLILCYVAVAALLLNLNVASAWGWKVKTGAILLVSALYVVTWFGIQGLEGWPTGNPPPERFRLQWLTIDEPDPSAGEDGAIFFWLRYFDRSGRESEPRAHVLPYDDSTVRSAREALELLQRGKRVEGRLTMQPIEPNREQPEEQKGGSERTLSTRGGLEDRPHFEFREMPPPDLPAKRPG